MGDLFEVKYDMSQRGISTLFKHKLFTIDARQRKDWNYDRLEDYLTEYELLVSESALNSVSPEIRILLEEMMESQMHFTVKNNNGRRYSGDKQYIKCQVPVYVLNYMKKMFSSTIIYASALKEIPQTESITFSFDKNKKTVTITQISIYEPVDDPYYVYARNAVSSLSVEAIGINQYGFSDEGKIKDFYNWDKISKWKDCKEFFERKEDGRVVEKIDKKGVPTENIINGEPGIYMLYDENTNDFYVGKARNLRERILQHAADAQKKDPIPNFTHYRYSVINQEYMEFLYLIENASIHDTAWMIDMPKAQKYKTALAKKTNNRLNDCRMVNTHERQRKKEGLM